MALQDDAFEADGIVLNDTVFLFAGDGLPHEVEPDAPVGSVYFRSNGEVYQKKTPGTLFNNWEENETGTSGSGNIGELPFYNSNGTNDNIDLVAGELPFYNADGTYDPIGTT